MSKFQIIVLSLLGLIACAILATMGVLLAYFLDSPDYEENRQSTPVRENSTPLSSTATPLPTATPIIYSFEGSGDKVVQFHAPKSGLAFAALVHKGKRNFIVIPYDPDGNRMQSLAIEEGNYSGETVFTVDKSGLHTLDISADGNWGIAIQPPQ